MTNTIAIQAAVVTMLLAKRPRLAELPIDWHLRDSGAIDVDPVWGALPSQVVEIAQELSKALRGARFEVSNERRFATSDRPYRSHAVDGKQSGIAIRFNGFEYLDGKGDEA